MGAVPGYSHLSLLLADFRASLYRSPEPPDVPQPGNRLGGRPGQHDPGMDKPLAPPGLGRCCPGDKYHQPALHLSGYYAWQRFFCDRSLRLSSDGPGCSGPGARLPGVFFHAVSQTNWRDAGGRHAAVDRQFSIYQRAEPLPTSRPDPAGACTDRLYRHLGVVPLSPAGYLAGGARPPDREHERGGYRAGCDAANCGPEPGCPAPDRPRLGHRYRTARRPGAVPVGRFDRGAPRPERFEQRILTEQTGWHAPF